MATYHCAIKVGYSGKTIPHLEYIKREGRYKHKDDDLVTYKSGNLPSWATSEKNFWEACASFDKRSYREIEFALPNELTREEQQEIVDEFIAEIIPNHAYTYAIHEVDTARNGIKNPHVHLMFSERIIDDRVRDLDKKEFFKQRGVTKAGKEFGGSIKDRSWAGKGRTKKFYEVRKKVADKINEKYKEKGLSERIDARNLQEQSLDLIESGQVESTPTSTRKIVRIPVEIYKIYAPILQKEIEHNQDVNDDLPVEIKERILLERQRILDTIILNKIQEHHQTLQPTKEERDYAYWKVHQESSQLKKLYDSPFSIFSHRLDVTLNQHIPDGQSSNSTYTQTLAYTHELDDQHNYLIKSEQKELLLADIQINKERLEEELKTISTTNIEDMLINYLSEEQQNTWKNLQEDVINTQSIETYAANQNETIYKVSNEIHQLKKELQAIEKASLTPEVIKEAKQLQFKDRSKALVRPLHVYEDILINKRFNNTLKEISEKIRSRKSIYQYKKLNGQDTKSVRLEIAKLEQELQTTRKQFLTKDIKDQALLMQKEAIVKHNEVKHKSETYYQKQVMNLDKNPKYTDLSNRLAMKTNELHQMLDDPDLQAEFKTQKELASNKKEIFISSCKSEKEDEFKNLTIQLKHKQNALKTSIHKLKQLEEKLSPTINHTKLEQEKNKIKRVAHKHKNAKKRITLKTKERLDHYEKIIRPYLKEKQVSYYEDKLINEITNNRLKYFTEKLRSQESLLKYNEQQGNDTSKYQEQIKQLKENIQYLRQQYLTDSIKEKAINMKRTADAKQQPINLTMMKQKINTTIRKRYASNETKEKGNTLIKAINTKLKEHSQDKDERSIGAASFYIGSNDDLSSGNIIR